MEDERETSSLRARRKKSAVGLGCFFNGHRRADSLDASSSSCVAPSPSSKISPSAWIRSKASDLPDAKIKGRYKNFMSRMGGRHRPNASADFSYDPLSYSLNFEEDDDHRDSSEVIKEFPLRSFAARLPLSPPKSAGDQIIRMKQQPELMMRTAAQPTITCTSISTNRAAAIAEVRKCLQDEEEEEAPCRINNIRKQQEEEEVGGEVGKSRSSDHVREP